MNKTGTSFRFWSAKAVSKPMRKLLARFSACESGNALTFTALAMPALIGGAGLAVDVSQWYVWKRELQYAVDQAAVAGAWAQLDASTKSTYATRAEQEYAANLSLTASIASTPSISLVDWNGGGANAVEVTASASKPLPFTGIFKISAPAVSVTAWATFEGGSGNAYYSCIVALDESASKAVNFNGGPSINSRCGLASLSTASNSINISGAAGSYDMGDIFTAGQVSDAHNGFSSSNISEGMTKLSDPFADFSAPSGNGTSQSLDCSGGDDSGDGTGSTSYTISYSVETWDANDYYSGSKRNSLSFQSSTITTTYPASTASETSSSGSTVGTTTTSSNTISEGSIQTHGSGNSKWYSRTDSVRYERRTVTSVTSSGGGSSSSGGTTSSGAVTAQPGTYSDFTVNCDVQMEPGIYVIDGGMLDINAQDSLTGNGVMFVLKNGAGIKINGGSNIDLTGMSEQNLIDAGLTSDDAAALDGMLIFEDRDSSGNNQNKINGNSSQSLSGIIYLPVSEISFLGSARGSSRCLSIAANTVQIGGNADMTNLCPSNVTPDVLVYNDTKQVRLVK